MTITSQLNLMLWENAGLYHEVLCSLQEGDSGILGNHDAERREEKTRSKCLRDSAKNTRSRFTGRLQPSRFQELAFSDEPQHPA